MREGPDVIAAITPVDNLMVGSVTYDYSDTVPAGVVISQRPPCGTTVPIGSAIDLVVSLGPSCVVPNLVCRTDLPEAVTEINDIECLALGIVFYEYNDIWPPGHVIDQDPPPGTIVPWGTGLDLVVSLGSDVVVPDVLGMSEALARSLIEAAGLTVRKVEYEHSDTVAEGLVFTQDPPGATTVPVGSPVDLLVSIGMPVVPDVVGMTEADANSAITAVDHLIVGAVTYGCSLTVPAGCVMSQNPPGGTPMPVGSAVDIEVVMVTAQLMPDVVGFTRADAEQALATVGCDVSVGAAYSDTIPPGIVISQDPVAATAFCPPITVNIVVSLGPYAVPVDVDIKPASCPSPLNVESKGILPVAILSSEEFDVNTIDIASIRLEGVAPIRSSAEDVATPVADGNNCECNTAGPDGYLDLTLKFKTYQIAEAVGQVPDRQTLVLTLTGQLADGTPIEGADCMVVVGKFPRALAARKADVTADGLVDILDFAVIAEYWLESAAIDD
jgi:beta-lactam-binding protein with PASTA domain